MRRKPRGFGFAYLWYILRGYARLAEKLQRFKFVGKEA
jgi:hypothetical protein